MSNDGRKENGVTMLWNVGVTLPSTLDVTTGVDVKDVTLAVTLDVTVNVWVFGLFVTIAELAESGFERNESTFVCRLKVTLEI